MCGQLKTRRHSGVPIMKTNLVKKVSQNIRLLRKQKGLTQLDMKTRGFHYRHYQKIESGTVDLSLSTIERLAKAFGVRPEKLLKQQHL